MRDRIMFLLVTLVGNPVTVAVKNGARFFGIFSAANVEGGELSVALASVQEILPAKDTSAQPELGDFKTSLLINYKDLETIEAAEVRLQEQAKEMREAREKEAFRTDTEISKAFDPSAVAEPFRSGLTILISTTSTISAATSCQPGHLATTRLMVVSKTRPAWRWQGMGPVCCQRSALRHQVQLRREPLHHQARSQRQRLPQPRARSRSNRSRDHGSSHQQPTLGEERGQADDSGVNEEDKYGAVVRSPNAYVPPALRKQMAASTPVLVLLVPVLLRKVLRTRLHRRQLHLRTRQPRPKQTARLVSCLL